MSGCGTGGSGEGGGKGLGPRGPASPTHPTRKSSWAVSWGQSEGLGLGAVTLHGKGLQGGAPVQEAGVQLFCGLRAGLISRPPKGADKGAVSSEPRGLGFPHKAWVGRGCQRRFLRLIPTSMKTAPGAASRPFVLAPRGAAAAGIPPHFCVSSPAPQPPSPPQLPGRPAAFQGFRLRPWDAQRGGGAPNLDGGGLTLGSARRSEAKEGRAREGCGLCPPLRVGRGGQGCAGDVSLQGST